MKRLVYVVQHWENGEKAYLLLSGPEQVMVDFGLELLRSRGAITKEPEIETPA
jgi:hypothetical protein